MLPIIIQSHCDNINWQEVSDLLKYYDLSELDADTQKRVFTRSYAVVFLLQNHKVVGVGRALSDGICQAAIYNVALEKHLHGKKYGRLIIEHLVKQVENCNIILYTHPKTVEFYKHLGFELMKTGLAKYQADHIKQLREMKFI